MRTRLPDLVAIVAGVTALPWGLEAQAPGREQGAPTARTTYSPSDSAWHALNRLAYGPRPGEVQRVAAGGVLRWIDQQLDFRAIDDDYLGERQRGFALLDYDRGDLTRLYAEADRERQERLRTGDTTAAKPDDGPAGQRSRRFAGQLQQLALVRAVVSERQLFEVMVDFWTNHFNVYFAKGPDRALTPDYIEHTIRRHAMGRFEDLLIATAKSPAMLFYLDNWQSVAPGATPPPPMRIEMRPLFGRLPAALPPPRDPATMDSLRERAQRRAPQGLNENYARELLELHTLGVDGGYTQQDVIAVARVFTGWSIRRPQQDGAFEFHEWAHDDGEKTVLGVVFPAGHGRDEGIRLLKLLAQHPATMHHVSRQLCQRFVNDDPPDGCVDDAVAAWRRSGGEIREVLRAIFHGPDFWSTANVGAKVKTPLEFVVSAARALEAEPDTTPRLAQLVARLGEPLYLHVAPDGYPEREDAWVNSGALLDRMNTAVALAAGKLSGIAAPSAPGAVPDSALDHEQLLANIDEQILGGRMSENTRQVIRHQLSDVNDPRAARAFAVGLAIGGPEFQRR